MEMHSFIKSAEKYTERERVFNVQCLVFIYVSSSTQRKQVLWVLNVTTLWISTHLASIIETCAANRCADFLVPTERMKKHQKSENKWIVCKWIGSHIECDIFPMHGCINVDGNREHNMCLVNLWFGRSIGNDSHTQLPARVLLWQVCLLTNRWANRLNYVEENAEYSYWDCCKWEHPDILWKPSARFFGFRYVLFRSTFRWALHSPFSSLPNSTRRVK